MITFFWLSLFVIFYTFLGYGLLLYLIVVLKRTFLVGKQNLANEDGDNLPSCTLIVAAYNEEKVIRDKILNSLSLKYESEKLSLIFITDGSTDSTPAIIGEYPDILLLHQPERKGKIAAVHRALEKVKSDIVVFTDANTQLNTDALIKIGRHYQDEKVGAVAGEKRVIFDSAADASAAGEGFYWKYESTLKRWDSELHSVVGAAGELFSVRTDLYEPVSKNAILDDFMISMLIAKKGYRIIYEPEAFATETPSENVSEELKRKVRIAAGGIQSVIWLRSLLNIFKYRTLAFQYISHRVLRWTISPILLITVFLLNLYIGVRNGEMFYQLLFAGQLTFYLLAAIGLVLEKQQLRVKLLFVPYYFCVMNYAVLAGAVKFFKGNQSSMWDKARRR